MPITTKAQFVRIVDREMRKHPHSQRRATLLRKYYKVELDLLGLSLPVQRGRFKKGYPEISALNFEMRAEYWFYVWSNSQLMESLSQALFFFESWANERSKQCKRDETKNVFDPIWPYLTEMLDRCDNWVHSDGISNLLSAAVEERPDRFKTLVKWNKDENPWRRRQSVVALHYYSRLRQVHLPASKTLPLIRNLLKDQHFYVQRGVGWAIRECYNVEPDKTLQFIQKHIGEIPPIGLFAAVEKLDKKTKQQLKSLRLMKRTRKPKQPHTK